MADQGMTQMSEAPAKGNISPSISAAVGLVLLALLAYGFLSSDGGRLQQGDPAPDFSLTLFDGSEVSLGDLRGQVVVVNFWASWCAPCRQEAPELQEAWEAYNSKEVTFLGVTFKDAKGASQAFIEEYGITYPNGIDLQGRISRAYGVAAVPETFIIDRDGVVAWFQVGAVQADTLARELDRLMNE